MRTIVTTLNILAGVAREVGGDRVEVTSLAKPNQDPHTLVASGEPRRPGRRRVVARSPRSPGVAGRPPPVRRAGERWVTRPRITAGSV
jgi:hypothetical protein